MTISEALRQLDGLKHNTYTREEKLGWLSQLDTMIYTQVLCSLTPQLPPFTGYDPDTPVEQALLVAAPFDQMYLRFLEAQIDYHNGEIEKYNNAITLFDSLYAAFRAHCVRQQALGAGRRFQF